MNKWRQKNILNQSKVCFIINRLKLVLTCPYIFNILVNLSYKCHNCNWKLLIRLANAMKSLNLRKSNLNSFIFELDQREHFKKNLHILNNAKIAWKFYKSTYQTVQWQTLICSLHLLPHQPKDWHKSLPVFHHSFWPYN